MELETVKIKSVEDYTVINKEDFDPETHELFEDDIIHDDFPGALSLRAAEITKLSQLANKAEADLTQIKGIGAATAKQILAKLQALNFADA